MTESPTRTRWLIIAMLSCIGALMYIDRVNISIAAKYIMPEYGLSEVQMGWIFSAFVLGYTVLHIPGGWLGDRFGPRLVLTGAIFWWSLFTVVTAVAGQLFLTTFIGVFGSFVVVRMLIGIGEGTGLPNYNRVVANWFAPEERGLTLGIVHAGIMLGGAVTPPFTVWIMITLGWQMAFYLAGGVGMIFALVWYWLATDRPEEHPWVNTAELQHITKVSIRTSEQSQAYKPVPWRAILGSADLWLLTAAIFALGYIQYIYMSWFYLYLVNVRGFSTLSGGVYSMAPFLVSAIAAPVGGWLSDLLSQRFGKRIGRCGIGFTCLLVTAGFIFAGASATDPYLAVLFLSLGSGSLFLSTPAYWATTIDLSKTYAGTLIGFINTGANLGGVISPILTPFIAQHWGWESAFYAAAALGLLGSLFWLGIHPERAIELGEEVSVWPKPEVIIASQTAQQTILNKEV